MNKKFWTRLGVVILIVLLLWWLYMALWIDEEEGFEAFLLLSKGWIIV